jgi:probable F420-dependent oxidoreductase
MQFPTRAVGRYVEWIGDASLRDVAQLAEQAGFDAIGVTDHPFPKDSWLAKGGHHAFDPFVSLAYMAAVTSKIRLVTDILVAGYRNPYLSAAAIASLDRLSNGRVTVGMAAGYLQPEFEVLQANYADRGERFDDAIKAMRAAWTGKSVDFDGPYFEAHGHTMQPTPVQKPGPPIWIGGNSKRARRRAVELGQGWMPIPQSEEVAKITKTPAMPSIEVLASMVEELQAMRPDPTGPRLDVCTVPFESLRIAREGSVAVLERLPAYERAGVTALVIEPRSRTFQEFRDDIACFGEQLIAPARST